MTFQCSPDVIILLVFNIVIASKKSKIFGENSLTLATFVIYCKALMICYIIMMS